MPEEQKQTTAVKPPEKKVANSTALERLKQLDEQRAKLLEDASSEARQRAEEAIADLNALGYNFRLVEDDGAGRAAGKKKITRTKDPNKPCSVCKFVTDPPHDARAHRNQEPKKPFGAKELDERGFKKRT